MVLTRVLKGVLTGLVLCFLVTQVKATQTKLPENTMNLPPNSIELVHGTGEATHAVIWLHGLGATANDFPPIVPELGLSDTRTIKFIFPQAPSRPITINGGMNMPGWYDIKGMNIEDKQDAEGMAQSQVLLESIVSGLIDSGIKSTNIVLAGFSQGGAVTYFTGIRSQHKFAGLLALSTYLPFDSDSQAQHSGANVKTPIFASHGTFDAVVPIGLGEMSVGVLKELGYHVDWKTYPMEHQVAMEQIQDIGKWIESVFRDK
ncbi:phospholipase/carboxylesterase [Arenicella sp. 4NH20-0111]